MKSLESKIKSYEMPAESNVGPGFGKLRTDCERHCKHAA
jgi:hypothetical protein